MVRLFQISNLLLILVAMNVQASPQTYNFASQSSNQGTLTIGRSTGIPGMFGRFTVVLNGKVVSMLGEKQIIKKNLPPGRHTLTIRDDVAYRKFSEATVRFSIKPSQKMYFIVNSEKKAFESRYRIVVKQVKRD